MQIKEGNPYVFKCSGMDLQKVLLYYGHIENNPSSELKIVCPFHKDVNPSMIVDLQDGKFFCFGCNTFGDAYQFVHLMNPKLNDLQTLQKYFKILKSNKVRKVSEHNHTRIRKRRYDNKELYNIAYDYYYGLSKVDWMKDESDEVTLCRQYMLQRGFTPYTLNKCHAKVTYNKSYAIIFPMLDNGMFKGWVCRTTLPDIEKKRKYLYNEGFSRATTLVGDYENQDIVFVVEGYMDRLKFIQNGVENVVAILGWKMSYEQEMKLKKSNVKIIVSALDNDTCGKKGTKYLRTIFRKVVRFCYLKGIKDPGEMSEEQFKMMHKKTMNKVKQQM